LKLETNMLENSKHWTKYMHINRDDEDDDEYVNGDNSELIAFTINGDLEVPRAANNA